MALREALIHHGRKLGEYNTGVVAQLGVLTALVSGLLGFGNILPEEVSVPLLSVATASVAASAWAKANQNRIDKAGDDLADLVEKYWKS